MDAKIQTHLEEKHPRIYALYSLARDAWRYVFCGYIILSLSRWLITTCGRIAESALLFCCLWITSQSVAPELFTGLGTGRIATITSVTLLLLALLPEIILFSAIITTLERLRSALAKKTVESWTWAILFLLPTLSFFAMTLYTLYTLAFTDHIVHQDRWAIVTRCVSAWAYALIGIVYASWHGEQIASTCSPEHLLQGLEDANRAVMQEALQQLKSITVELVEERLSAACSPAQIEAFTVHQDDEQSERTGEQTGVHSGEKPILSVPGIPQEKVDQILTLHLQGMAWREIPGNYSKTIKPIKEAYEVFTQVNSEQAEE